MKYLGVDPGGVRMGFAWADDETGVVVPGGIVDYRGVRRAAEVICRMVREHGAGVVVLGLPADADGNPTPACQRTYRLAEALTQRGCRVELQSEYLTTNEARRRGREAGLGRGARIDHLAAQIILEEYLSERGCAAS
ncbi:MAG: Holliday junction resolvase RuvX [Acidobacteria bacterium]|nr:Holliday junction resolvase RuvX [Acidobacteriota bacterium]